MENLKDFGENYLKLLEKRSAKSRVYQPHQLTGLALAEILGDSAHKSLYMKLAKIYDNEELLRMAKNIAEMGKIKNRGAYFMKILKSSDMKKYAR